ncbi:MAG: ethanolamine ammonia-lyase subunit EutC [Xanthobacteraceae bacterium]
MIPDDVWTGLRRLTPARIGLARSGAALATGPLLEFRLAHARARDAVGETLDEAALAAELAEFDVPVLSLTSAAENRQTYLLRPDLGRRLAREADGVLSAYRGNYDLVFVLADGLSARAVQVHAPPVLSRALTILRTEGWRIAPFVIVRHGRVAVGDAAANALGADCVAVLIGERPGLSAPDSLGAYLTYQPHPHTTDAERNCISNIRPQGVDYVTAALRLTHLLRSMRDRRLSGVRLKDESDRLLVGQ